MRFLRRLTQPRPLLLDGATGTELERRAVDVGLPLWSANALLAAPQVLRQIHADYMRAGAEIITADTFRTHRRNLVVAGMGHRAEEMTHMAVRIARSAIRARTEVFDPEKRVRKEVFIAGSIGPLEDCYSPDLVPPQEACEREHAEIAQHLADADVDLILVETMNTVREAYAATHAARVTGLPVLTGFVCRTDGRLFSGETVTEAVEAIAPLGVAGLMVNCTPATTIHKPLAELVAAVRRLDFPMPILGVYANIGQTNQIEGWTDTADVAPIEYARLAAEWLRIGANLIGGCCGTTPAHISAVRGVIL